MSNSLTNRLMVGLSLTIALVATMMLSQGNVYAQVDDGDFVYEAQAGDNLTKLARKSVQLYADANDITLSTGQVIAAETCVVNKIGASELTVGQVVELPATTVADAVTSVSNYSEARSATWSTGRSIDQALSGVNPTSAPAYVSSEQLAAATDAEATTDEVTAADNPDSSDSSDTATATTEDTDDDSDGAPWYWWLIGVGAVGAMWYILGGNEIIAERRKNS